MTVAPLSVEHLHRPVDPASLPFDTTAELSPLDDRLGQARAVEAIELAIAIARKGYNIFAMGPAEAGKATTVRLALERHAAVAPVPEDVVYVADFEVRARARALRLPAGRGRALERDVAQLVEELRQAVPATLESEEIGSKKRAIEEELKTRQDASLGELSQRALTQGVALVHTPMGFALAPVRAGEIIAPDEFAKLPDAERAAYERVIEALGAELQRRLAELPRLAHEARRRVKELVRETLGGAVAHLLEDLKTRWADLPAVAEHLDALGRDVLDDVGLFLKDERDSPVGEPSELGEVSFRRYRVNVIVDHGTTKGAPVVFEEHPTYDNLFGRIEHAAHLGALVTDHNLVKAGALHRANGGYLVLDARNLLVQPLAWEALKRALDTRVIKIDGLGRALGLVSTVSLEPEPVTLEVKVVLVGDRRLKYLLETLDPEYAEFFKVTADFDDTIERRDGSELRYARLLAALASDEALVPLDRTGVARVVEHAARLAEDSARLLVHVGTLRDLLSQADHFARQRRSPAIAAGDVEAALEAEERREGRIHERMVEAITRGTYVIDTEGAKVGQVNGLSVVGLGRARFGRPSRITARVRLGRGEVLDIEREVELGGPLHSKGVLILSGYLAARYAREHPLSLGATITFEQSYGVVEGDSAASAELYAILSAIAELPLRQTLAVTGSVNQLGEVQAIGGANEKIEGFFELCAARGLRADHGVLIPAANVVHLMLKRVVRDAVAAGRFRIYPIATIDEGIELLTGVPAEAVHRRVEARLVELAMARARYGRASARDEVS